MKLQPNFSWQKYVGRPEDEKQQFQYQLQQEHIVVANSVNATIDDASSWTRERQTAFTWIDGKPIYTKTVTATLTVAGANPINHGITGIERVIRIYGTAQDAIPLTTRANPIPHVDPNVLANGIEVYVTPTQVIVVLAAATYQNYLAAVTIEYTKV
jgi:hypothetical protein